MEKIVRALFEYGKVERDSCSSDVAELLAIVKKIETKKGVYLGKKDQETIKRIEEEYKEEVLWDTLTVAEKMIVAKNLKNIAEAMGYDMNVEITQYQRGLNR